MVVESVAGGEPQLDVIDAALGLGGHESGLAGPRGGGDAASQQVFQRHAEAVHGPGYIRGNMII